MTSEPAGRKASPETEIFDEDAEDVHAADMCPAWLSDLRQSNFRNGYYRSIGDYALCFSDRSSEHLVVSFDNLSSARDKALNRDPWGYGFVAKNGWSQLGVMAFAPAWFRDEGLIDELVRLSESGFFRRFKSVTLTGTSMGGYAACAFASLVPGCRVIAFSPQSTLKKALVPWEKRFSSGRKADWSGRFSDAAAEISGAASVWLVYDPALDDDARHVNRFAGQNVHFLRARMGGHKTALILRRAGILSTIVRDVVEDRMTEAHFYQLYRSARQLPWFLNGVAEKAHARGRPDLVARVIKLMRNNGQHFMAHQIRTKYLTGNGPAPLQSTST